MPQNKSKLDSPSNQPKSKSDYGKTNFVWDVYREPVPTIPQYMTANPEVSPAFAYMTPYQGLTMTPAAVGVVEGGTEKTDNLRDRIIRSTEIWNDMLNALGPEIPAERMPRAVLDLPYEPGVYGEKGNTIYEPTTYNTGVYRAMPGGSQEFIDYIKSMYTENPNMSPLMNYWR